MPPAKGLTNVRNQVVRWKQQKIIRVIEVNVGELERRFECEKNVLWNNFSSCGVQISIFPLDSQHSTSFDLSSMLHFWRRALKIQFECCAFFPDTETCLQQVLESTCCLVSWVCIMGKIGRKINKTLVSYLRLFFHTHTHTVLQTILITRQAGEANWCLMTDDYKRCVKVMFKCVVIDLFLWSMFWLPVCG